MSYWTPKGLSYIASGIGKPLFVDKIIEKLEPMNFARICIEISSSSALTDKLDLVVLDDETGFEKVVEVRVEYQNKPQSCSHCNSFGHSMLECPHANYQWVPKAPCNDSAPPFVSPGCDQISSPLLVGDALGSMASVPPDPSAQVPVDNWTVVSRGSKQAIPSEGLEPGSSSIPVEISFSSAWKISRSNCKLEVEFSSSGRE